jgi:hypothetical protein
VEQVLKWDKGNDIWAAVLLGSATKSTTLSNQYLLNGVPQQIEDLIREYDQIFQHPTALPPRLYDHANSLIA